MIGRLYLDGDLVDPPWAGWRWCAWANVDHLAAMREAERQWGVGTVGWDDVDWPVAKPPPTPADHALALWLWAAGMGPKPAGVPDGPGARWAADVPRAQGGVLPNGWSYGGAKAPMPPLPADAYPPAATPLPCEREGCTTGWCEEPQTLTTKGTTTITVKVVGADKLAEAVRKVGGIAAEPTRRGSLAQQVERLEGQLAAEKVGHQRTWLERCALSDDLVAAQGERDAARGDAEKWKANYLAVAGGQVHAQRDEARRERDEARAALDAMTIKRDDLAVALEGVRGAKAAARVRLGREMGRRRQAEQEARNLSRTLAGERAAGHIARADAREAYEEAEGLREQLATLTSRLRASQLALRVTRVSRDLWRARAQRGDSCPL